MLANGSTQIDSRRRSRGAVAVDVVAFDDDFAEIDPDPVADALGCRRGVPGLGRLLDLVRAVDRRHHAGKFDQRAIAHQLDEAAAVRGDARIENGAPVRLEARQRARLVALHEAAVADDGGGKDHGQLALHRFFGTIIRAR